MTDGKVSVIAGQEMGTKTEHIRTAAKGECPPEKVLMIGDAPDDLDAAKADGALFHPVSPRHEEESGMRFLEEALERFFAGTCAGDYEESLVEAFHRYLPDKAPWES